MICFKSIVKPMKNQSLASQTNQNLRKYNDLLKHLVKPKKKQTNQCFFEVDFMENVCFPLVLQGFSSTQKTIKPKKTNFPRLWGGSPPFATCLFCKVFEKGHSCTCWGNIEKPWNKRCVRMLCLHALKHPWEVSGGLTGGLGGSPPTKNAQCRVPTYCTRAFWTEINAQRRGGGLKMTTTSLLYMIFVYFPLPPLYIKWMYNN